MDKSEDVICLVKRLSQVLTKPIFHGELGLSLSISLGASLFPDDATNTTELLHIADQAMYHIKRQGGNGYSLYRPAMTP
ncbi:MAG TPA: hypothetical protein DDZ66_03730 [Firmicutes bacterium]|nr:hypothetical protein [Bacillota bacterium]